MPIYRGAYFARAFVLKDSTGAPLDLTDWEFRAQFRDDLDSEVVLELTSGDGGLVATDPTGGRLEVRILAEESVELPIAKLVADIMRTDASPGPVRLFGLRIPVRDPVTRDG